MFLLLGIHAGLWANEPLPYVSGYASQWSNPAGQPMAFHLSGMENPEAELHVYDVNRKSSATTIAPVSPQTIDPDNSAPWLNGLGYDSQLLEFPELTSGLYFLDGPEITSSRIPFIVSDPEREADIVVVYPTNTVNAYSQTEDVNLYTRVDGVRPAAVSFHRPQDTGPNFKIFNTRGLDQLLPTMDDYTYKYIADSDLDSYESISGSRLVIVPGHSEYWTVAARRNFDEFVNNGGAALVLSGNTMFRSVGYDDPDQPTQLQFSPRVQFVDSSVGYPTWESIGVDFHHGGNGSGWAAMRERIDMPYDGWKILDASAPYLASEGVEPGDIIRGAAAEYDGVPYTECDPVTGPVVDTELLGFHQLEVIAFENASYGGERPTCAAWIDFRRQKDSGRQITVGGHNAALFSGPDAALRRNVVKNMIELLLHDQADFNGDDEISAVDVEMLIAEMHSQSPSVRYDMTNDNLVSTDDLNRMLFDFANTTYGDIDLDGRVDFSDFLTMSHHFGRENATWSQGDFTGDGKVAFDDYLLLSRNYGHGDPTIDGDVKGVSVPEPNAMLTSLLAVAFLGCMRSHSLTPPGQARTEV